MSEVNSNGIVVTGGTGLLGRELRTLMPEASYPSHDAFDVTDPECLDGYLRHGRYRTIVHAAAFTSPPRVQAEPATALQVNIVGTANVVQLCMTYDLRLVYISTDYVFRGDKGYYREEDDLYPVNTYGWSKLGGECAARLYSRALIVRTSFGPNVFPFATAFVDQWTSRECVREIAAKLIPVIHHEMVGVIHVGGPRRTVYEYACSLDSRRQIRPISIHDIGCVIPRDASLDCHRFTSLVGDKAGASTNGAEL